MQLTFSLCARHFQQMALPRILWLLSPLTLSLSFVLAQDTGARRSDAGRTAGGVVLAYYHARDHFNLEKARALQASDLIFVGRDGSRREANPSFLPAFMAYEKTMHGHWHCRVLDFQDGLLEAEITEENDYYRYLGSGKRIEVERFRVFDGQIHEIIDVSVRYTGRTQDSAYHEFIQWLSMLPESERQGVLRDGKLVFDEDGAHRQLPLLKRFYSRTLHDGNN